MIVNIRGTSGSGKTTLVRAFMGDAKVKTTVKDRKSRRTLGYILEMPGHDRPLFVVGPYTINSGGCDYFKDLAPVFWDIVYWHEHGFDVLFEGLLVSRHKGRMIKLWEDVGKKNLFIIQLATSLDDCLEGIRERRLKRGVMMPVNHARTEETYHRAHQISSDLLDLGVPGVLAERESALNYLRILFRDGIHGQG